MPFALAQPPLVFQLAGHPLRWRLLGELAQGDRRVRELTGSLGQPQSLVSYHLRRLRSAGLVASRRSSFDARDSYYRLDLARCRALLAEGGAALHPALGPPERDEPRTVLIRRPRRVLFLCTGNSARSLLAEALVEQLSGRSVRAVSAGSEPKPIHPNTIRVLRERGIDPAGLMSKHLSAFSGQRFDFVISLCDRVREVCPEFPGEPETIHWSVPDPGAEPGHDADMVAAFRCTADELAARIAFLLQRIQHDQQGR